MLEREGERVRVTVGDCGGDTKPEPKPFEPDDSAQDDELASCGRGLSLVEGCPTVEGSRATSLAGTYGRDGMLKRCQVR